MREAFPRACYAVKAFSAHAVLRIVLDEGLDLLASTGGEVEACLRAGAPAARIVMHGNAKTDAELELAVEAGVGLVIADGLDELRRLDAVARARGRVQPVLLRVVPEVEVETHEAIATGHDASKFGTSLAAAPEVLREAAGMAGLRVDGLHAHVGSQVLDAAPYLQALDTLLDLAARVRARRRARPGRRSTSAAASACATSTRPPSRWRRSRRPCSRDWPSGAGRQGARDADARRGTGAVAHRQRRGHALSGGGRARRSPPAPGACSRSTAA